MLRYICTLMIHSVDSDFAATNPTKEITMNR